MQSAKEAAGNLAASAKAGMEKTKATAQEQGEKMTTRDPLQRRIATQTKEERINEAERQKLAAREQNAAAKHTAAAGGGAFTSGTTGAGYTPHTAAGGGAFTSGTTGAGYTAEGEYPQVPTGGVPGSQNPTGTGQVPHHDPNAGTGYGTGHTY